MAIRVGLLEFFCLIRLHYLGMYVCICKMIRGALWKEWPTCINSSRNEVQVDKVVPDLAVVSVDQVRNRLDHTVLLKP